MGKETGKDVQMVKRKAMQGREKRIEREHEDEFSIFYLFLPRTLRLTSFQNLPPIFFLLAVGPFALIRWDA